MKYLSMFFIALVTVMAGAFSIATAEASRENSSVDLGAEIFLVEDKTIAGLDLNIVFNGRVGVHIGFDAIVAKEIAPRHNVGDNWLGGLFGAHLFFRVPVAPTLEMRIGTGVDAWLLSGIASGESKYAWPIYLEGRLVPARHAGLFIRARHYIVHSEGLLVGEDYNGTSKQAILLSAGAVYVF
jgi:hypothetical protein